MTWARTLRYMQNGTVCVRLSQSSFLERNVKTAKPSCEKAAIPN